MKTTRRSVATLCLAFFSAGIAIAQTPQQTQPTGNTETVIDALPSKKETPPPQASTVIVTASASSQRVRYVSIGEVNQSRLQVFSIDGSQIFDSDFKLGNLIDWQLVDQQGQRLDLLRDKAI